MQQVSEYILDLISSYDVHEMFGVPGYANYPFYAATNKVKSVKTVLARHEGGASWMALGYALGGKPFGVCTGTSGAGTTNIVSGVVAAYANSVPMLVLTGQVETTKIGRGAFQELSGQGSRCPNVHDLFRCMTKFSETVWSPSQCERIVSQAFDEMLNGRPGPVHINVPLDVQQMPMVSYGEQEVYAEHERLSPNLADRFNQCLKNAKRPLVLVGRGCRHAVAELNMFLEKIKVPYSTSIQAKGLVREDKELYLGILGVSGSLRANHYFTEQCDLLICLGSSLNEFTTNSFNEKMNRVKIFRIDIDEKERDKYKMCSEFNCLDAKTFLNDVSNSKMTYLSGANETGELPPIKKPPKPSSSNRISPVEIVECVQNWAPHDALITADSGNNAVWVVHYLTLKPSQRFFIDINTGCMGSGIVSAVGFQFADRKRPVVAMCGDGGFMMNGMEIAVAAEHQLDITWIVFNDAKLGMVAQGALAKFNLDVGSSYSQSNIAAMAQAMGVKSCVVETRQEFQTALQNRRELSGPYVIDVRFDDTILPDVYVRAQRSPQKEVGI